MNSNELKQKNKYESLLIDIKNLINNGKYKANNAINTIITETYWNIGKRIVEYEQKGKKRAKYGSNLLKRISLDIEQSSIKGFSVDTLERIRTFYLYFRNSAPVERKLSWYQYCIILRLKNDLAKEFYMAECEKERWSKRELLRQINSMLFERVALSKNKKEIIDLSKKGRIISKSEDLIKDPYVLEFLGLNECSNYTESELEQSIIDKLRNFMLELGHGFMFVARQKRITLDNDNYYIDLVFYNRVLRCFVLIELKIGKLTHQALGQLQMYVNYYDKEIKGNNENPTIGILLCADKKQAIVKYTLPENNNQIFASEYMLCLPNKQTYFVRFCSI